MPKRALVPVAAAADQITNLTGMDSAHAFDVRSLVATLCSCHNGQILFFGFFVSGQNLANAGTVNAHGLFGEKVFAFFDDVFDHHRPEAGRGGQNDQIHVGVDHLLVSVKTAEGVVVGDVVLIAKSAFETLAAGVEVVWKQVGHGVDFYACAAFNAVFSSTGAASATAYKANLDGVAASSMDGRDGRCGKCAGYSGRGTQKISARGLRIRHFWKLLVGFYESRVGCAHEGSPSFWRRRILRRDWARGGSSL